MPVIYMSKRKYFLTNGNIGTSRTVIALGGHDLVVEGPERHSQGDPFVEVVCGGDCSAGALGADRPVLLEGGGAQDGRLVGAGRLENIIDAAI